MSDLLPDLQLVASEESQQDWNRAEYGRIYRSAFIDGANYAEEQLKQRIEQLERERDELQCAVATAIDIFDDYEMDVDGYPTVEHVRMKKGLNRVLAQRDIEQQVKALEWVLSEFCTSMNSDAKQTVKDRIAQLRAQEGE